jgi:rhodanese-related sulfurtransferase
MSGVKDIEKVTTEAIAYNIPWKMWANGLTESDGKYKAGGIVVKYLFGLIIQEKFPEKTTPLILMCRSGHRSSAAADYLESLGYTEVYEIDNRVKEASDEAAGKEIGKRGGRGGFQGTGYSSVYNGYRGYPNRLPLVGFGIPDPDADSSTREVETVTADLDSDDKDDSVSWSDTGLPISQTFPLDLVWQHLIQ